MRVMSRFPSSTMKSVKTTCWRIHTGIWYSFPFGCRMVESASYTWASVGGNGRTQSILS
jgi:hypothetical protein